MKARLPILGVLGLTAAAIAIACGSSTDGSGFDPDGGASSGSSGASSGSSGFGTSSGSTDGSTTNNDGAACSAPVDMYIMFDRSGSMGNDCNIGQTTNSKWCRSINALSGYFSSAGSTDQAAALQFFPLTGSPETTRCTTGAGYDTAAMPTGTPAYQTLPSNVFDALLNSTKPDNAAGGTPTEAAIRGLTTFTAANRRPGRVTIGILITDGDPNGCDEDLTNLSNLLDAHHTATQIRTYVIGMQGATDANLEQIAQGGGGPLHDATVGAVTNACGAGQAGPCRHWNVGSGDPAVFTAALAAIQDSADGCKDGGGYVNPVN
jgi:hypothetical protein